MNGNIICHKHANNNNENTNRERIFRDGGREEVRKQRALKPKTSCVIYVYLPQDECELNGVPRAKA